MNVANAKDELLHLQAALENAIEAISRLCPAGRYLSANRAYLAPLGYETEELIGQSWEFTVHPDDVPLGRLHYAHMVKTGRAEFEIRGRRKDGSVFFKQIVMVAINDSDGRFQGHYCFAKDVSERRAAEARLARSELQLAKAQAIAQMGSWEWNLAIGHCHGSAELRRLLGASLDDALDALELLCPNSPPEDRRAVTSALADLERAGRPLRMDYRVVRGGETRRVELRAEREVDREGKTQRLIGTAQDVTELRDLEAKLRATERIAAIGTLVAGVAHEINNPIAFVSGHLWYIREQLERQVSESKPLDASTLREAVEQACEGTKRIQLIVQDLKNLSRADAVSSRPFALAPVIRTAIDCTKKALGDVTVATFIEETSLVHGDAERLCQVLVNLLTNAAHAMAGGKPPRIIHARTRNEGPSMVVIEVQDFGTGIAPSLLGRMFEPFFTTKPVGMGTGLGLSVSHALVSAMGGELKVRTAVGEGSTFSVVLRAAEPESKMAGVRTTPIPARPESSRGRVLVVDDEEFFGASIKLLLQDDHSIECTTRAKEALERVRAGEHYDMILCDLMMPEMNGMELYQKLLAISKEQAARIVFSTGCSFGNEAQRFLSAVENPVLEKPFEPDALRKILHEAMTRSPLREARGDA